MSTSIRKALQEEQRKRYLNALVSRAVFKVLAEQDMGAGATPPAGVPAPMTPPADVSAPPPEEAAAGQPKEFTVDDMIERLNVIRGGRSFTDPEVYGQLVTFFKKQTEEQKTAIEQFLIEIGKIVINVNDQEAPPETSAAPPATPPPTTEAPPPPPAAAAPPAV